MMAGPALPAPNITLGLLRLSGVLEFIDLGYTVDIMPNARISNILSVVSPPPSSPHNSASTFELVEEEKYIKTEVPVGPPTKTC